MLLKGLPFLSFDQWLLLTADKEMLVNDETISRAFEFFAVDKNHHKIKAEDVKNRFDPQGEIDDYVWTKLVLRVDVNVNGELEKDEFEEMVRYMVYGEDK